MTLSFEDRQTLDRSFSRTFGSAPRRYFSAPGRTELGGNHTDHQGGRVLAAAVDLDTRAAAAPNGTEEIRICSQGYPLCRVSLRQLTPVAGEAHTTAALIRGVAAWFVDRGCHVAGFDACVVSSVLPGSGLSSSAAFEVLMAEIINVLFSCNAGPEELALAGQYAENVFFGKPCGLMDQMASAVGNAVAMDFAGMGKPRVRQVPFACPGYGLCIVNTGGSHGALTEAYAAIPREMGSVAAVFGQQVLSQVPEETFLAELPRLRSLCGDRAVLRAFHFYGENRRVDRQVQALEQGDLPTFLNLVRQSGQSSYMYLQNVLPEGDPARQELALALALCQSMLGEDGAFRVHGGGFAGTVQAFVPLEMLEGFRRETDRVLGPGACLELSVRPRGAGEIE